MRVILISICVISILLSCSTSQDLPLQEVSIQGQWKLTSIQVESPVDLNDDGETSVDLFSELDDCYTDNILVIDYESGYAYNTFWVYSGVDHPESCPNIKHHQIRVLPTSQFFPNDQRLDFIHKYFVDSHQVVRLDETTLELEGSQLLRYQSDPPVYINAKMILRRLTSDEEIDVLPLLKFQGIVP